MMAGFYSCGDFYLKLWFQWAQSAISNGPFTFKLRERAFGEHRQHETERGEAFPGVIILLFPGRPRLAQLLGDGHELLLSFVLGLGSLASASLFQTLNSGGMISVARHFLFTQ
jgi:hypothetical protein